MAITETIQITTNTRQAVAGFEALENAGRKTSSNLQGIGNRMVSIGQSAGLMTAPLAIGLGAAGKIAVDFNESMLGVSRALDLGTEDLAAFRAEALKVAPPLGLLPTKFVELATEAGRLGVAKNEIMGFTQVVAEISAITDLQGKEVTDLAKSFAALQTITGATSSELEVFGAAVNKMDDAIGGTTPQIIEFVRQTAAAGKLLGVGVKDLAAYGSAMQSLGIRNSVAYRAMNSMLTKLAAPQTLSNRGIDGLKALNINVQEMIDLMTTDANQGIGMFLGRIKQVADVDVSRALGAVKDVMGADYADEILTLAVSHEKLGEALKYAGDSFDQANLAKKSDELAKRLGGVKGQTAIAQAQLQRLSIAIGSAFLPSLNSLLGATTPLVEKFAEFAEQNPKIVQIGVTLAGVALTVSPLLIGLGSLISAISTVSSVAGGAIAAIKGLSIAGGAATTVFAGMTAPIWGVLAASVALGAGIGVLIAYWDKLPAPIYRATSEARTYLGVLVQDVLAFPSNVAQVPSAIGSILGAVGANFTRLRAEVQYRLAQITSTLSNWASSAWDAGVAFMSNLGKGISAQFANVLNSFRSQLATLRGMLPGSEPKIASPLSKLALAGQATMDNFTSGFNQASPQSALTDVLGQTRQGLSVPVAGGGGSGGGSIVINDNRTININGGAAAGNGGEGLTADWILDILRRSDRELLDILEKGRSRVNRNFF